ncbi:hypothetical protein NQ317_003260, partial [Molorchus minor]
LNSHCQQARIQDFVEGQFLLIDVHEVFDIAKQAFDDYQYPSRFALPHSPRFTKNIKVQNVLRFSINSRQSVFNTVYSVRCLSCQGKLSRSCPNNISINSHKKHGRWNEKMAEADPKKRIKTDH